MMKGGHWTFNNHVLIFQRVQPGDNVKQIPLDQIFIWMQIHNILVGFRFERIVRSNATFVSGFMETDANNFLGSWHSYLLV